MRKRSWMRPLFTRPVPATLRKAPPRGRPTLEVLEDRCVPSTFTVTNTDDTVIHGQPSHGTLRWAVEQANSTPGANTIAFSKSVFSTHKTITMRHGELDLSNTTGMETITGPAAGVTVNGGDPTLGVSRLVTASISGMTISGSTGYGGVSNYGTLTLTNCTVSHNSTAGYFAMGAGLINRGTATLINCTVSDNTVSGHFAAAGAGVYNYDTLTLTNSTISGNIASKDGSGATGGGLENAGTATLTNCTISGNIGGGLANGGTVTLANTIVAGNDTDVSGGVTSLGNNLIGATDGSSGWVSSDLTGTSAQPLNPLLAPLGHYGGPTQTMALLPGSPAIDAGNNALIPSGVTTDQRGRSRIINSQVDIGAFESRGFTLNVTSGSGQSTGVLTAFPAPLVVTVTARNPVEPVAGGLVTFTPPAGGASATVTGSPAPIASDGTASVPATANGIAGSYTVSATATGNKTAARFSLTNTASMSILAEPPSADSSQSPLGDNRKGSNELDYGATVLDNGKTAEPAWTAADGFFADTALVRTFAERSVASLCEIRSCACLSLRGGYPGLYERGHPHPGRD